MSRFRFYRVAAVAIFCLPQQDILENRSMRALIGLTVITYLVGVGVALSPTIGTKWNGASASDLVASVAQALPNAAAWPARAYRSMTEHG
jgi:hypothetical protein